MAADEAASFAGRPSDETAPLNDLMNFEAQG
jgi:hypothetical protein